MSFYNVANPVNFSNLDGNAKRIAPLCALQTIPTSQYITSYPAISGLPSGQLSVQQVLAGFLMLDINWEGTPTIYLPKPQELLAGLRNSSVLENRPPIGLNDFIAVQLMVWSNVQISSTSYDGTTGASSYTFSSDSAYPQLLFIRFDNITAGQEHYEIFN